MKQRPVSRQRGFTLIELLVVLAILGLLGGLVVPNIFKHFFHAQHETARTQIKQFELALDAFRLEIGRYPTTQEGLTALATNPGIEKWDGPYLKKAIPLDPWGKPYHYQSPGAHGDYDILSYGKDGSPGGEKDNKDIMSWE